MKSHAICLEVFVEINKSELKRLGRGGLNNMLRFPGNVNGEEDYYIPMEIQIKMHQKEVLKVEHAPENVYFGNAEHISFFINKKAYDCLQEKLRYAQKFPIGGKLIIEVIDR